MTNKRKSKQQVTAPLLALLTAIALLCSSCSIQANPARPVEEEQIKNVVKDYFVRQGGVPDYEVTIEKVEKGWARVRISPVGVDSIGGDVTLYLQNQDETLADAPPATLDVQPGSQARVTTTSGWTIVAGPQAQFTENDLNTARVPELIRP